MKIIPLVILVVLSCISLGVELERTGKPKEGKYSFLTSLFGWILQWALILWALGVFE